MASLTRINAPKDGGPTGNILPRSLCCRDCCGGHVRNPGLQVTDSISPMTMSVQIDAVQLVFTLVNLGIAKSGGISERIR